jgi:hypothetical protein
MKNFLLELRREASWRTPMANRAAPDLCSNGRKAKKEKRQWLEARFQD